MTKVYSLICFLLIISNIFASDINNPPFDLTDSWTYAEVRFIKETEKMLKISRKNYKEFKLGNPRASFVGNMYPKVFWLDNIGKSLVVKNYTSPKFNNGKLDSFDSCTVDSTVIKKTEVQCYSYPLNVTGADISGSVKINDYGEPVSWDSFEQDKFKGWEFINKDENGGYNGSKLDVFYRQDTIVFDHSSMTGSHPEWDPEDGSMYLYSNGKLIEYQYYNNLDFYYFDPSPFNPVEKKKYKRNENGLLSYFVKSKFLDDYELTDDGEVLDTLTEYDSISYSYDESGNPILEEAFTAIVDSLGKIKSYNKTRNKNWIYKSRSDTEISYTVLETDLIADTVMMNDTLTYIYDEKGNIIEYHKNGVIQKYNYVDNFLSEIFSYNGEELISYHEIIFSKTTPLIQPLSKMHISKLFVTDKSIRIKDVKGNASPIELFNILGKKVETVLPVNINGYIVYELDNLDIAPGLYLVSVTVGDMNYKQKLRL